MALEKTIPKANHCIRLFLLILFFQSGGYALAQSAAEKETQKAFRQFLNFQLDSCSIQLKKIQKTPDGLYLRILLNSTRLFVGEKDEDYKKAKKEESELVKTITQSGFSEPDINFLISEVKLQHGLLKLKFGDEFSGFWNLRQAYSISKQNVAKYPTFIPSYKTLGLCHILFGVLPGKYNWILSILGIDGDVKLGLAELRKVSNSNQFYAAESRVTEALFYTYLLNAPETGAEMLSEIQENRPQLLIDYAYSLALMKNARSEAALEVILEAERIYRQPFALPQLYYLKGEIYLQKGQYELAIYNYQQFLDNFSGQNLIKDACYKIGICRYLSGDLIEADSWFSLAKQEGRAKNETDKNAQNALDNESVSAKELFMIRYATDGGYFDKAFEILNKIDTSSLNLHDKCELYYRAGRLYEKTGNLVKAKAAYAKTIDAQSADNWYFAPNAALRTALILAKEERYEEAVQFLNLIDHYKNYPYENSITQQAAAATKNIVP